MMFMMACDRIMSVIGELRIEPPVDRRDQLGIAGAILQLGAARHFTIID